MNWPRPDFNCGLAPRVIDNAITAYTVDNFVRNDGVSIYLDMGTEIAGRAGTIERH